MTTEPIPEGFAAAFREMGEQAVRDHVDDGIEWLKENAQPRDGVNPEIIVLVHHDNDEGLWWINGLTFERSAWHLQQALLQMYRGEWSDGDDD